jgi:hypothetical protein
MPQPLVIRPWCWSSRSHTLSFPLVFNRSLLENSRGATRNVRRARFVASAELVPTVKSLVPGLADLLFPRASRRGAIVLSACKADWEKARSKYAQAPQLGDELLSELFDATDAFFRGPQGRAAFRGGWAAQELFGITLEKPRRFGVICAAVFAKVDILDFDGPWVWIRTSAIDGDEDGDSIARHIRTDYRFRQTVPWWRHSSPVC